MAAAPGNRNCERRPPADIRCTVWFGELGIPINHQIIAVRGQSVNHSAQDSVEKCSGARAADRDVMLFSVLDVLDAHRFL